MFQRYKYAKEIRVILDAITIKTISFDFVTFIIFRGSKTITAKNIIFASVKMDESGSTEV